MVVNRIEINEMIITPREERGLEITPALIIITFIVLFITFLLGIFYGNFRTKRKNSLVLKILEDDI